MSESLPSSFATAARAAGAPAPLPVPGAPAASAPPAAAPRDRRAEVDRAVLAAPVGLRRKIAALTAALADRAGRRGVTMGEVRERAVADGILEAGASLAWLSSVPRAIGLHATRYTRPSPVKETHGRPVRVYVYPTLANDPEAGA